MKKPFSFQPKKQTDCINKPNTIQEPLQGKSKAFSPIRSPNYAKEDRLNEIDQFHQVEIMNEEAQSSGVIVRNQIKEKVIEQSTQPTLDYIKSQTEFDDLDFINTLLKLKGQGGASSGTINHSNYDLFYIPVSSPRKEQSTIHINNDDSKSYIREILDICEAKPVNTNSNDRLGNNVDNWPEKSNEKVPKGLKRNDLIEITNRRKMMADSMTSVDPYLRRRHLEELAKVEKIRKDNERKELGDGTFMPKINKKSKIICERLTSGKYQPINELTTSDIIEPVYNSNESKARAKSSEKGMQLQSNHITTNEGSYNEMTNKPHTSDDFISSVIKEYTEPSNYHDWIDKKYQQYNNIQKANCQQFVDSKSIEEKHIILKDLKPQGLSSSKQSIDNHSSNYIKEHQGEEELCSESSMSFNRMNKLNLNHTSPLKDDSREFRRINLKAIKEEVRQKAMMTDQNKFDNNTNDSNSLSKSSNLYIQIPFDLAQYQLKSLMNQTNQEAIDESLLKVKTYHSPGSLQMTPPQTQESIYHLSQINHPEEIQATSKPYSYDLPKKNQNRLYLNNHLHTDEEEVNDYVINNPVPLNELVKESNMSDNEEENGIYLIQSSANNMNEGNDEGDKKAFDSCMEQLFSPNHNYYSNLLGQAMNSTKSKTMQEEKSDRYKDTDLLHKNATETKDIEVVKAEIDLFDDDNEEDEREKEVPESCVMKVNPLSLSQDNNFIKKTKTSIEAIQENDIEFDIEELMNPKYLFKHANHLTSINEFKKATKEKNSKSLSSLEFIVEEHPRERALKCKFSNSPKQAIRYNKIQPKKAETASAKPNGISTVHAPSSNLKAKYEFKPKKKPDVNSTTQLSHRNKGLSSRAPNIPLKPFNQLNYNQSTESNAQSEFEGSYFKRIIQQEKSKIDSLLQSTENLASNILSANRTTVSNAHSGPINTKSLL